MLSPFGTQFKLTIIQNKITFAINGQSRNRHKVIGTRWSEVNCSHIRY
jgi:hypothetical protein